MKLIAYYLESAFYWLRYKLGLGNEVFLLHPDDRMSQDEIDALHVDLDDYGLF